MVLICFAELDWPLEFIWNFEKVLLCDQMNEETENCARRTQNLIWKLFSVWEFYFVHNYVTILFHFFQSAIDTDGSSVFNKTLIMKWKYSVEFKLKWYCHIAQLPKQSYWIVKLSIDCLNYFKNVLLCDQMKEQTENCTSRTKNLFWIVFHVVSFFWLHLTSLYFVGYPVCFYFHIVSFIVFNQQLIRSVVFLTRNI